jgi:ribosomal protein L11 methyltransferase
VIIYPAWVDRPDTTARYVIAIEPGVTFGMGDHPTTILTMRAMRPIVEGSPGLSVLDVGCGSGVLAVAACLFGAGTADGIDISPACVPTTHENAALNGVTDRVSVSTTDLRLISQTYDLVLANILAPTLIELAEDLKRVLTPHGTLVISGILANNHAHVLRALEPLVVIQTDHDEVWTAITLSWK